ncbi:copper homeostasis protein CutC [Galbibacter pacificus]|uniref:PF03932 family protein CutC n=1 Tax=Galbibacter pacificus TaxID=2996052 RepID=A0ABT6FTZ5_9FLAO|nr:copper homeostasis protein CutC [Galbibacter pacificus]MDG3583085.1 copper homeostasis protein CutC [Galbibacter pacificus]MDG3586566.1 copper homeostasis protein CutC [Galbibacter pacificus]
MIVEICSNSVESACSAQKGGADRIELCAELEVGGITPSYGVIKRVVEKLSIPVFVLIRPRSGNFTYTHAEFETMKEDIKFCREIGCKGIVSGVLNQDNTLDAERTKELIELARPLSFTFHRAFDWVPNPDETMKNLIGLGCDRVLTSGQQSKALDGLPLLTVLQYKYGKNIKIMPGSGIDEQNVLNFKENGFIEIHFSASVPVKVLKVPPPISFNNNAFDESFVKKSDQNKIWQIVNKVK